MRHDYRRAKGAKYVLSQLRPQVTKDWDLSIYSGQLLPACFPTHKVLLFAGLTCDLSLSPQLLYGRVPSCICSGTRALLV